MTYILIPNFKLGVSLMVNVKIADWTSKFFPYLNVKCAIVGWASATTAVASEGFNKFLQPLFDHSDQICPSCSKPNEPHITWKVSESRLLFQEATEWHSNVRNIVTHKVIDQSHRVQWKRGYDSETSQNSMGCIYNWEPTSKSVLNYIP